jgi:hypothetical protein
MGKDEGTQIAATAAQHKFVSPSPVLSTPAKGVSELSRFLTMITTMGLKKTMYSEDLVHSEVVMKDLFG